MFDVTMRPSVSVAIALGALLAPAFAGEPTAAVRKIILAKTQAYLDAMLTYDGAAMEKLLCSEVAYTSAAATLADKASLLKQLATGRSPYSVAEMQVLRMHQFGDTVVAVYDANFQHKEGPVKQHGIVTIVWIKRAGNWVMVARHASGPEGHEANGPPNH